MLNILSFDGGPGPFLQIRLLLELVKREPRVLDEVDLFAGTSNGALVALYLAHARHQRRGRSAETIVKDCIEFTRRYSRAFNTGFLGMARMIAGGIVADTRLFERIMEDAFGQTTLADLETNVAIVSFDTKVWTPRVFRNFGEDRARDGHWRLSDVAQASGALPPVMPIFGGAAGEEPRGYLDGFLSANNPTMSAVSLAIRHLIPDLGKNPLELLRVLSLGACQAHEEANLERRGGLVETCTMMLSRSRDLRFLFFEETLSDKLAYLWSRERRVRTWANAEVPGVGPARWGWPDLLRRPTFLFDLMLHGLNGETDRQCVRLLGEERYHRCELSTNLLRDIFNLTFHPRGVELSESTFGWEVARAVRPDEHPEAPLSSDESDNAKSYRKLVRWIDDQWLADRAAPPAAETRPQAQAG
jgi:hypothetical protein